MQRCDLAFHVCREQIAHLVGRVIQVDRLIGQRCHAVSTAELHSRLREGGEQGLTLAAQVAAECLQGSGVVGVDVSALLAGLAGLGEPALGVPGQQHEAGYPFPRAARPERINGRRQLAVF